MTPPFVALQATLPPDIEGALLGLDVPELLTPSQWIERHRFISEGNAYPGLYSFDRTPYLREPIDALNDPSLRRHVWQFASQVGKTDGALGAVGYWMAHSPRRVLILWPTDTDAKINSKTKVEPLIEDTPELRERVARPGSRDSGNTWDLKVFPGGFIRVATGQTSNAYRASAMPVVVLDELDKFPRDVQGEGDPVSLVEARQETFLHTRIGATTLLISSPTTYRRSAIESYYELSDRRRYYLPCPECGGKFVLVFSEEHTRIPKTIPRGMLHFDDADPTSVRAGCPHCSAQIEEKQKPDMVRNGEWIPDVPERSDSGRGYHLSALYTLLGSSWEQIAEKWVESCKVVPKLKAFVNTVLAETYVDKGDAPEWEELYRRRERYPMNVIPKRASVLVAGLDVQKNRIECLLLAYGPEMECWVIDRRIWPGDPSENEVWKHVERLLGETFKIKGGHEDARARVSRMAIDAGYLSSEVYKRVRGIPRAIAVRGQSHLRTIIGTAKTVDVDRRGNRIARGGRYWPVGTDMAKEELFAWLKRDPPLRPEEEGYPRGWCHINEQDPEFFRQLCSEVKAERKSAGRTTWTFQPIRDRNEVLDMWVYARGAAETLGLDRWSASDWEAESKRVRAPLRSGKTPSRPGATVRPVNVRPIKPR